MSDQNVITDYRTYFASLGSGNPMSSEQLESMRDKESKMHLIMNAKVGGLCSLHDLSDEACLDEALSLWTAAGKPQAWLQLGHGTQPWFCSAEPHLTPKR